MEMLQLVEEGSELEEKEKEIKQRRYFLLDSKETVEQTDTRVKVEDVEIISENAGIVRNSSISDRLEIITKNQ